MESNTVPQLDYKKRDQVYPSYQFTKCLPNSGGQTFPLSGAGSECIIELPVRSFNLSRSYLYLQIECIDGNNTAGNSGLGANLQQWYYSECLSILRQLQLYTRSNVYAADIYEVQNYTNLVWKLETKMSDFLSFDQALNSGISATTFTTTGQNGFGRFLQPSYLNLPGLANHRHDGTLPQLTGYEPLHYWASNVISVGAANTIPNGSFIMNIMFPMSMIYNSIFAVDKDIFFNEVMVMRLVFNGSNRISFTTTGVDLTNPTLTPTAPVVPITLKNVIFYLATEENLNIQNELRAKVNSAEGFSMLIPYIYTTKSGQAASTSQTVSIRYNSGYGLRLKKIYYGAYNATESLNTAYDHSNINGSKIQNFYTQIDNVRLQQYNVDCTNSDGQSQDYLEMQKYLRGSLLSTDNLYQYNWVWVDSFDNVKQTNNKGYSDISDDNYLTGLDLSEEKKYDIICTTTNFGFNHYVFAITEKLLMINSQGVSISKN